MIYLESVICLKREALNPWLDRYTDCSPEKWRQEADMFQHSKILVWYKIASQKVVLGEAHSDGTEDVVSLWLHAPTQFDNASNQGYWLSLFDDGGREIGNKWVSMRTADAILCGGNRARA
ncbi:hypothetical protein VCB_003284 [Vibrio cholerae TMA 21]|nr:hypothetical protein VCA_003497 [Vibrio cholerae VL426]EEO06467.1 hypothetical protein VIF_001896 [Vibrio cholerae TM 11079-80]EEO12355.1 hypothetical protein VCB_003284 [Vibrio cholerae TMA 21]